VFLRIGNHQYGSGQLLPAWWGVREQNFHLAELRAIGKEGEEPSWSKIKDTPVPCPTKSWFQWQGSLEAQAGRLAAD